MCYFPCMIQYLYTEEKEVLIYLIYTDWSDQFFIVLYCIVLYGLSIQPKNVQVKKVKVKVKVRATLFLTKRAITLVQSD
jgi:hypothetical protein